MFYLVINICCILEYFIFNLTSHDLGTIPSIGYHIIKAGDVVFLREKCLSFTHKTVKCGDNIPSM